MIVGISDLKYTTKPTDGKTVNNSLYNKDLSINDLAICIGNGQTFCNAFKGKRGKDNFDKTEIIVLDIDHTKVDLDYIKKSINGIIYYPTFSDGKDNLHSFRVIVKLNEYITTRNEYAFYANILIKMLESKGVEVDMSCNQAERMFFGTCNKVEVYDTDFNYTKFYLKKYAEDNNFDFKTLSQTQVMKFTSQSKSSPKSKENGLKKDYNSKLVNDFMSRMSYGLFLKNYLYYFEIIEKPKIDWNEDELCRKVEDYIEIKNRWRNKQIVKYQIGEDRKNKLFNRLIVKKQICPEVSFECLLVNAVYDVVHYFVNSDNKLNKEWLYHIVKMVYDNDYTKSTTTKRKLNMELIREQGISWQSVVQGERRIENENNILSCFDSNLSLKDNYNVFINKGFKLSYDCYKSMCKNMDLDYMGKRCLKRTFNKDSGNMCNIYNVDNKLYVIIQETAKSENVLFEDKIKELYNPSLTQQENLDILNSQIEKKIVLKTYQRKLKALGLTKYKK